MLLVLDILNNLSPSLRCRFFMVISQTNRLHLKPAMMLPTRGFSVLIRRQHLPSIRGYLGEDDAVRGPAELVSLSKFRLLLVIRLLFDDYCGGSDLLKENFGLVQTVSCINATIYIFSYKSSPFCSLMISD